ncbi:4275_t:CDS:10, partial [Acaulospora colombiana]
YMEKSDTQVTFPTGFVKKADIKAPEVRHEVAHGILPYDFSKSIERTGEPARTYPFTLDPFQEKAIACIERGESVLISAHTSAGKTVVAEYAIALSLRNKQRVIYTSPIKALSNQKYRELQYEFKDVGLMTVRGVVWEETIILLPHNVHFVFLSATIPNALEFAEWICNIHQQPCHVVYTEFRPTPLQHYLFPDGADGIYLVIDENCRFREDNFQKAVAILENKQEKSMFNGRNKKNQSEQTNVFKLIKTLMVKNLNPVIAFAFSKMQCENLARQMSVMDFNNDEEKELIKKVVDNAIDLLAEEDRDLPWFHNLLPLLQRGIGVHHSGLIPFMKEIVELLFQEGLIKVLFATETFAMGLNMPAKTVVFCEISKFDGIKSRNVSLVMNLLLANRLDARGFVVMSVDHSIDPKGLQEIFKGEADHLISAFHLKYHMVLNMSRIEGISPEHMLEQSFYQFQNAAPIPRLKEELSKLNKEFSQIDIPDEEVVALYHNLKILYDDYDNRLREIIFEPQNCLSYVQFGRVVRVKIDNVDFGWAADNALSHPKHRQNEEVKFIVRVLLKVSADSYTSYDGREVDVRPCLPDQPGICLVTPVELKDLQVLSQYRFYPSDDLEHDVTQRQVTYKGVQDLIKQNPDGKPLDPIEHMKIKDERLEDLIRKLEVIKSQLKRNPTANNPTIYERYLKKLTVKENILDVQKKLRNSELILHLDELKKRKRLLRRLGYLSKSDVVEFKGRVACEITSGDELVLTELLLNGIFNDLSSEKTAALLSCFVGDESSATQKEQPSAPLSEEYAVLFRQVQTTARNIADLTEECNIPIDKDVYLSGFSADLMDGVFHWCKNATFKETCARINMFEGNIVRNFRSLDELIRAMVSAAKIIGTYELECKFSESREKLRRGIIFAASLYL